MDQILFFTIFQLGFFIIISPYFRIICIFYLAEESRGKHAAMNAFIIASKAEPLTIKTARPPDPPSNLGVIATSCSGIKLAWDQPREHGVEVIG